MCTTFPLEKVKYLHQKVKDVVFGYLREAQLSLPQDNNYYNIASIIQHICVLYYRDAMDSDILTAVEQDTFFNLLHENNKFEFKQFGYLLWKMLYRATRDGFEYEEFVKHCFNKKYLVCIIRTESNNVFGGYTSKGFPGDGSNEVTKYVKDAKAFMFLLRSSYNYPAVVAPIKLGAQKFAIATCKPYYCIFGSGWDFYCTSHKKGNTYIASYKFPKIGKYLNGPDSGGFNVTEIEVFQLI